MSDYKHLKFKVGDILCNKQKGNSYHKLKITGFSPGNYHFKFLDWNGKWNGPSIGSDYFKIVDTEWVLFTINYNKFWNDLNG